jgi:hypothetical protein
VLFTDRPVKLHFSYQRFLENQIREAFGFGFADLDYEPGVKFGARTIPRRSNESPSAAKAAFH